MTEAFTLRNGETIDVACYQPGVSTLPAGQLDALWEMVVRPREPWTSAGETEHFTRSLRCHFVGVSADRCYVAWSAGRPLAHAALFAAADNPRIGAVGFVLTEPAARGRGLCPLLMERLLDDFRAAGGQCALLGAGNPTAHAIYARAGFRDYNGHVMRWLPAGASPAEVDEAYFARRAPARVRAGHWGDAARIAWLYARPGDWFMKDYSEALYDHPALPQVRCGSILPAMMLNVEARAGGLWMLETDDGRVVGAVRLSLRDTVAQTKSPMLDFLIAPAFRDQTADLLRVAIEAAQAAGAEVVRACLASCDVAKADIVQSLAFRLEATLAGQFAAGAERFDLNTYVLEL
jgi:GNAT superfamily N-acetyltransferase